MDVREKLVELATMFYGIFLGVKFKKTQQNALLTE